MVDSIKSNSESSGAQEEDQFAFDDNPDANTLNQLKRLRTSNSFVPFNEEEFVYI